MDLLTEVLRGAAGLDSRSLSEWDLLVRQARHAALLPRLAAIAQAAGHLDHLPIRPRRHLHAALVVADKQQRDVSWEIHCLRRALTGLGVRVVLLKGAAYLAARLPMGHVRLFGDIDLLVSRHDLPRIEKALVAQGWESSDADDYDQRYYRRWMHEVPPLRHFLRQSVTDLHHTIAPPLTYPAIDPALLLAESRPIDGLFAVLSPADMVLHSALHLFNEGEPRRSLRDLDDIRLLLGHFGSAPEFWRDLVGRAQRFAIGPALDHALFWSAHVLGAPVPAGLLPTRSFGQRLLDQAFRQLLRPDHASCRDAWTRPAQAFLYLRGHALRLPPHLLVPHLLRKAVRSAAPSAGATAPERTNA